MIRKRIVRQLLEVIRKFFPKDRLSTVYWPRCLRDFIADIARQLAPTVKEESYAFDTEECIALMSKPTTEYIVVGYRKYVRAFLLFALRHCSTRPVLGPKPGEEELVPSSGWPVDIVRSEDLREAIGSAALRSNVASFLFFVQRELSIQLAFSYVYDAEMPITLEVPTEEQAKTVEGFLEAFGSDVHRNLAPLEVIVVRSRPDLLSAIDVKEESFLSSVAPLKRGTLGAILDAGGVRLGISCAHVMEGLLAGPIQTHFDGTDGGRQRFSDLFPTVDRVDGQRADAALFRLPVDVVAFNAMKFCQLDDDVHRPVQGELVYKIGAKTGLTIGKLRDRSYTWQDMATSKVYREVVRVDWEDDHFADFGDCGALYCIKRGSNFPVLGIHRNSAHRVSFGSDFSYAMELLLPATGAEEFAFVNPDAVH